MLITTHEHHITSKIPISLWEDVFNLKLDMTQVTIDGKDFADIAREDLPKDPNQALILLLIFYPNTSIEECHKFLKIKEYSFKLLFEFIIHNDRMDILQYFEAHKPAILKKAIQDNNYQAFQYASKAGARGFITWCHHSMLDDFPCMVKTLQYPSHYLLNIKDYDSYPSMINSHDKWTHPIAAKISKRVWEKIFHGQCYTRYLDLNANFSDLKREDLPKNDEQALTVLILNYPTINPMIFQLHFKLVPMTNNFLELAPLRIDIYQWLQEQHPNELLFDARRFFDCIFHAIETGSLSDFEWIKAQVNQETFIEWMNQYMIHFKSSLFMHCIHNKRLDVLQWFYTKLPELAFKNHMQVIHDNRYEYSYGCIPVLDWLHTVMPSELDTILTNLTHLAPPSLFRGRNVELLKWLKDNKSELFNQLIRYRYPNVVSQAFESGDTSMLQFFSPKILTIMTSSRPFIVLYDNKSDDLVKTCQWLQTNNLDAFNQMLENHSEALFESALKSNNHPALQYLKKLIPDTLEAWFKSNLRIPPKTQKEFLINLIWIKEEYSLEVLLLNQQVTVSYATEMGFLDALIWMKEHIPSLFNPTSIALRLLDPEFSDALKIAGSNGYLDVLKWHFAQFPADFDHTFRNKYPHLKNLYSSLLKTANLDTLIWLQNIVPDPFQIMMISDEFSACISAAGYNDIETLQWIKENLSPVHFNIMLETKNFTVLRKAITSGNLETLKWLKEHMPNMFQLRGYGYYQLVYGAAQSGHFDIVMWLEQQAPQAFQNLLNSRPDIIAIAACVFGAFTNASFCYSTYSIETQNYQKIAFLLLTHPLVFSYAERDTQRYGSLVNPFVERMIETLQNDAAIQNAQNTNAIFNLDAERAKFYFYIARNIIRRNDPALNGQLHFLFEIPAIKALAHAIVGEEGCSNELLRLAMFIGNQYASEILMNIEAVRQLAEENNYYIDERTNGINLRQLARDRESSMTALTEGEALRFKKIISQYKPQMRQLLASNIMAMLREDLKIHYQDAPAFIMINKKRLNLPIDYDAFLALELSPVDKEAAYRAYYAHTNHTALRYISKPNRWMHPNAAYVCVNEDRTQRWSTFEDYQNIICLFYLAARDEDKTPLNMMITPADKKPVDEKTAVELRLQLFFKELALIGRAHNWDRDRVRDDGRREEYDDLEADRPSCFSGVKRRLFQSVQDHPLLIIIEQEHMEYELREFAFAHFKSVLSGLDANTVKRVFDAFCAKVDETKIAKIPSLKILDHFNIPKDTQDAFIQDLSVKYGTDFNRFKGWIQDKLALDPKSIWKRFHLMSLYSMTDFYQYLQKVVSCPATLPNSRGGSGTSMDPVDKPREVGDPEKIARINAQLAILLLKVTDLANNGYTEAHKEAKKIHKKLTKLVTDYEHGTINDTELKEHAAPILEKRHQLEQFRGWKLKKVGEVLANLAILILSLGISYAVTQQFTLFKVKTDAHEKIEALSEVINTNPK